MLKKIKHPRVNCKDLLKMYVYLNFKFKLNWQIL